VAVDFDRRLRSHKNLHFFEVSFLEFQETQRGRMEVERGVISLREENLTPTNLKFA